MDLNEEINACYIIARTSAAAFNASGNSQKVFWQIDVTESSRVSFLFWGSGSYLSFFLFLFFCLFMGVQLQLWP